MKVSLKKLLKTYMATTVKEAIEAGELNLFNAGSWAINRNGGIKDMQYINEVTALVEYYINKR